jgi:hypothetical protein
VRATLASARKNPNAKEMKAASDRRWKSNPGVVDQLRAKKRAYYQSEPVQSFARSDEGRKAAAEQARKWRKTEVGKAAMERYQERYRIEKPERLKARDAVNNAVKAGKLSKQPCAVCGSSARIHGHHEDYSKPLEVIWLCPVHHKERHRQIQEEHEASYQFDAISE